MAVGAVRTIDSSLLLLFDLPPDTSVGMFGWARKGRGAGLKSVLLSVHPADNTRMDLIIPGEQYFYLKARNAVERQKWLVALGTAKACLTDSRTQKEKGKNTLLLADNVCFIIPHAFPSSYTYNFSVQPLLQVFGAAKS